MLRLLFRYPDCAGPDFDRGTLRRKLVRLTRFAFDYYYTAPNQLQTISTNDVYSCPSPRS